MALNEVYVDHLGLPMGDGTIASPYLDLNLALTQEATVPVNGTRINIKTGGTFGASFGSPIVVTSALPPTASASAGKPLTIQPYDTAAGDTTDLVYLSGGGSSPWSSNTNLDGIAFSYLAFQDTGFDYFFNLDNNIVVLECEFDGCGFAADNNSWVVNSHFRNLSGSTNTANVDVANGSITNCTFEGSGNRTGQVVSAGFIAFSSIYFVGEIHRLVGLTHGSRMANCTVGYDNPPTSKAGGGVYVDDFSLVNNCYFQNCRNVVIIDSNADSIFLGKNAHHGTSGSFQSGSATITGPNDVTLLSAAGAPNLSTNDPTPTAELLALQVAVEIPGTGISTYPPVGSYLTDPSSGGGGPSEYIHIPRIRTIT